MVVVRETTRIKRGGSIGSLGEWKIDGAVDGGRDDGQRALMEIRGGRYGETPIKITN